MASDLSCGSRPPRTSLMPISLARRAAARWLSPVSRTGTAPVTSVIRVTAARAAGRVRSGGRGWFLPGGPAGCAMTGLCFCDWSASA
jgi:hypothetical protein